MACTSLSGCRTFFFHWCYWTARRTTTLVSSNYTLLKSYSHRGVCLLVKLGGTAKMQKYQGTKSLANVWYQLPHSTIHCQGERVLEWFPQLQGWVSGGSRRLLLSKPFRPFSPTAHHSQWPKYSRNELFLLTTCFQTTETQIILRVFHLHLR